MLKLFNQQQGNSINTIQKPFDLIAKLPKNAGFVNWWTLTEILGTEPLIGL